MQANVHTPQRLDGESLDQYRARRAVSKLSQKPGRNLTALGIYWITGKQRRSAVKAAGGIRQFKRNNRVYPQLTYI